MALHPQKNKWAVWGGFSVSILLLITVLFETGQADGREPNQRDCQNVGRVAALLPPHVTAFYGVAGLTQVENIKNDLDRALSMLLVRDKSQFDWQGILFEEIILECELSWREQNIHLFEQIQKRVNHLYQPLAAIESSFPNMSPEERGKWLGEGILAAEIPRWKNRGLTPFAARMEKMRQKK
jgi:hypothetical protein